MYAKSDVLIGGETIYINLTTGNKFYGVPSQHHIAKCACGGELLVVGGWVQCTECHYQEPLNGYAALTVAGAPRLPGM